MMRPPVRSYSELVTLLESYADKYKLDATPASMVFYGQKSYKNRKQIGIEVHKYGSNLFLSQHRYIVDLFTRAGMHESKPLSTPMPKKAQQKSGSQELFTDVKTYRSLVGGLQYLTFTRPDISYSVNYVCQFMQAPTTTHFQLVKRILRFVQGTATLGILIMSNSSLDLYGFSDAD
ncbi:uncharacterized mitochondrial protein AtMg00810-like [Juglans microcarpa x Juglans regia]|uniref:uncharacterized mitochondrial protein AtMg00810-like n=1 Tax=Juglans microcarpa x Juglans regia TaxID=2249226 RepID=UPI001B7EBA59|nr:uncharacterized mitochondrial protein AtMg00810-like [Juglans microcarpa x Juglans regia]